MSVFNLDVISTESETIKASSHEKILVRYTHRHRRSNELLNDSSYTKESYNVDYAWNQD